MTVTIHLQPGETISQALIRAALIAAPGNGPKRAGVRAVIEHLAAELLVMNQRNEGRLSAHDAAALLLALRQQVREVE